MSIEIKKYSLNKFDVWNKFVEESNNGTLFHTLSFLEYHPEAKFDVNHLMILEDGNILGVLPIALFSCNDRIIAKSPYGASFGGLVIKDSEYSDTQKIVHSLMNYLISNNISEIWITPPPLFYYKKPTCYTEFLLLKCGFRLEKREITSVISLDYKGSDPFAILQGRARTAVRKAKQLDVLIEESDDYSAFYEILLKNKNCHNATPTHSLNDLLKIKELCPNSLRLNLALVGGQHIAGILYFVCNPQVVMTFYICHSPGFEKYNAVNLLLYEGIMWAKHKGYKYLDLGTTTVDMEPREGLFKFKESLGSAGHFKDTYLWENK